MYDLAGGGGQVSGKDNFLSFDRIGHRAVCLPVVDDAVQEMGCLFREGVCFTSPLLGVSTGNSM